MRLNRLLETRPTQSRPLVALGATLMALALTPFALAEVKQEATGEKADGEANFDYAVLISPAAKVTSEFGERVHPVTKEAAFHSGTDIGAPLGTAVHTPDCGKVVFSGYKLNYGETVEIAYGDGSKMRFAQLEDRMVEVGEEVRGGSVIGTVGMSGKYATGPHLHLERWVDGEPADPHKTAGLVLYAAG